jgi:ribosomal-protein-alanine N-acetyltransferase
VSVNQFLDRSKPDNISKAVEFIKLVNKGVDDGRSLYWAICLKDNPQLAGTICLWNFSADKKVAEIGFELSPAYQGMGIMQEAVSCVLEYAFDTISLQVIDAFVHKENIKSIRLLEKNNFVFQPEKTDENDPTLKAYSLINNRTDFSFA